jgi:hypothetical protein
MGKARNIADSNLSSLAVDNPTLVVDATNDRVGIGTSSPSTKLEVNGTVTATSFVGVFPSGTKMMFVQTNAPTGWTKDTSHNNKALRVVSGTASSGGSVAFTTAFASQAVSGSVGNTTLATSQIPNHDHVYYINIQHSDGAIVSGESLTSGLTQGGRRRYSDNTIGNGGSGAHNHSFTGTAINMAVQYVDVIIATKD